MNQKRSVLLASSTLLGALFIISAISGLGVYATSAASQANLNNVQIFVQPSTSNLSSYSLTVYNSSGYSVMSATSNYPAFAAELPSGTYLFTVTAMQQGNYCCYQGVATPATSNGVSSPMIPYKAPVVEYGYIKQQVSGPSSFNITTTPIENISTSSLALHVYYANGTAAAGVSVQASIVGGSYYYGQGTNVVMWNQTTSDGSATLVLPNVPVEISAWTWIPINLPTNDTTVVTSVGGEQVNVTVYWSPTYVGLAGNALIMPPFTSQSITLHAQQQPQYWVMPYGTQTASGVATPQGAFANNANGVPSAAYPQYQATSTASQQNTGAQPQISPLIGQTTTTTKVTTHTVTSIASQGANSNTVIDLLAGAVVGAIILSVIGMSLAMRKK